MGKCNSDFNSADSNLPKLEQASNEGEVEWKLTVQVFGQ